MKSHVMHFVCITWLFVCIYLHLKRKRRSAMQKYQEEARKKYEKTQGHGDWLETVSPLSPSNPKLQVQMFCWFIAFENGRIKKARVWDKLEFAEEKK